MKRLPKQYEIRAGGGTLLGYRAIDHGEYGLVTVKGDREYFYPWQKICSDYYSGTFYHFDENDSKKPDR